jgi:hypothetical protein
MRWKDPFLQLTGHEGGVALSPPLIERGNSRADRHGGCRPGLEEDHAGGSIAAAALASDSRDQATEPPPDAFSPNKRNGGSRSSREPP